MGLKVVSRMDGQGNGVRRLYGKSRSGPHTHTHTQQLVKKWGGRAHPRGVTYAVGQAMGSVPGRRTHRMQGPVRLRPRPPGSTGDKPNKEATDPSRKVL